MKKVLASIVANIPHKWTLLSIGLFFGLVSCEEWFDDDDDDVDDEFGNDGGRGLFPPGLILRGKCCEVENGTQPETTRPSGRVYSEAHFEFSGTNPPDVVFEG